MRTLRQEVLSGLQLEDSLENTHRREALLVYLSWLQQEIYLEQQLDCSRKDAFEQRVSDEDNEIERRPLCWTEHECAGEAWDLQQAVNGDRRRQEG